MRVHRTGGRHQSCGTRTSSFLVAVLISISPSPLSAQGSAFVPGQSYFGRNQYIEYIAGNSPYIISAPHGGTLTPTDIPDRTEGETATDSNVRELSRAIGAAILGLEGRYPHVVLCHLRRTKLDANRDTAEAFVPGNAAALQAWMEFHSFIDTARQSVARQFGKGLYVDIHGHGHPIQRLELGYLLTSSELGLSDSTLNSSSLYGSFSSIRAMIAGSGRTFAQLLRGPQSLGALFEERGFPSVPSLHQPDPGVAPYFSGGYNTRRHGSSGGGTISGVQLECYFTGVRDTELSRGRFASAFADAIRIYASTMMFPTTAERPTVLPARSRLMQNYPNPFNPATNVEFEVSDAVRVSITVLDLLGREVATLADDYREPGIHRLEWNATGLPGGVYFCRMRAANRVETRKMILVR